MATDWNDKHWKLVMMVMSWLSAKGIKLTTYEAEAVIKDLQKKEDPSFFNAAVGVQFRRVESHLNQILQ